MSERPVAALISAAFQAGFTGQEELHRRWIRVSAELGSRLKRSSLMMAIQRIGQIDILLHALERERKAQAVEVEADVMSFHFQHMMSEVWVLLAYEAARTIRERTIGPQGEAYGDVYRRIEVVRMIIAKHEIATERLLKEPLTLESYPARADDRPTTYDPADALRAHIAPIGLSERGSVGWWAIDLKAGGTRWVERQQLSDDLLSSWETVGTPEPART